MHRIRLHILCLMFFALTQAVYAEFRPYEEAPEPINPIFPQHPTEAFQNSVQGKVILQVWVSAKGRVDSIKVVQTLDENRFGMDAAAVAAVKKWRFTPGKHGGKPIATSVVVPVEFKPDDITQTKTQHSDMQISTADCGEVRFYLTDRKGNKRTQFAKGEKILLHYEIENTTHKELLYLSAKKPGDMCKIRYDIQPEDSGIRLSKSSTPHPELVHIIHKLQPGDKHEKVYTLRRLKPGWYVVYIVNHNPSYDFWEGNFQYPQGKDIHFSVGE